MLSFLKTNCLNFIVLFQAFNLKAEASTVDLLCRYIRFTTISPYAGSVSFEKFKKNQAIIERGESFPAPNQIVFQSGFDFSEQLTVSSKNTAGATLDSQITFSGKFSPRHGVLYVEDFEVFPTQKHPAELNKLERRQATLNQLNIGYSQIKPQLDKFIVKARAAGFRVVVIHAQRVGGARGSRWFFEQFVELVIQLDVPS